MSAKNLITETRQEWAIQWPDDKEPVILEDCNGQTAEYWAWKMAYDLAGLLEEKPKTVPGHTVKVKARVPMVKVRQVYYGEWRSVKPGETNNGGF